MYSSKNLEKFINIKHCFFTRNNGCSSGIYKSLNCGPGSSDDDNNVTKNLSIVCNSIDIKLENLILMNQTHGNKVIIINEKNMLKKKIESDALITQLKGIALGVLTADCVPIILYDEINKIIGCIHAGWKGAIAGVIENTIDEFRTIGTKNIIHASVGPCIGFDSYEVSEDFYKNFLLRDLKNNSFFKKQRGKCYFNIRAFVINKLRNCDIKTINNVSFDTFKDSSNFFSYRRAQKLGEKDYGRCISTICLKN
ncbi:peptidoglycan editing factor PgeF [Pelagibacteraceae bacterium]|nr:peptidoglycan editing factor PgeF [Pelagibacteraceae bacterium]